MSHETKSVGRPEMIRYGSGREEKLGDHFERGGRKKRGGKTHRQIEESNETGRRGSRGEERKTERKKTGK